ncbi:hypothetical protein NNJEOMEG_03360 [Fundidesulfovibrio magnetotacticus]|uniref:Lipoprotein n=1 Tax=Fundidesulfovibrio magnetotacticus TaxID=2730080 RepID=A0A6V8M4U6_9BACT|nr:hypothetical protein [Fundidesulfovibrio magnetotacticus]GFK95495.1 hypothetical protein NNJEOMEG_03360 [Fundidesulfovibrio magnetotacticus]
MRHLFLVLVALLLVSGCDKQAQLADSGDGKFAIDLKFKIKNRCQGPFPEVLLLNVPQGTEAFEFKMIDLSYNNYDHGTAEVKHPGGSVLAEGTVPGLLGPCFTGSSTHTYKITVKALGKGGQVLGVTEARKSFTN